MLMPGRSFCLRIGILLLTIPFCPLILSAQQPWDARAFSARPADMIAAAKAAIGPSEDGVVVLLEETQIIFDTAGRAVETEHFVYRIGRMPDEDWSAVVAVWQPWRQQRPTI